MQRCQVHKLRNVSEHLVELHRYSVQLHMRAAFRDADHDRAKRSLLQLQERVARMNPSAANSLAEGLDDMLTLHRLGISGKLRESLSNTNIIESSFSMVETICRRVKHWQAGDHRLRWAASCLCYVESHWRRIKAYRELKILTTALQVHYEQRLQQRLPSKKKSSAA